MGVAGSRRLFLKHCGRWTLKIVGNGRLTNKKRLEVGDWLLKQVGDGRLPHSQIGGRWEVAPPKKIQVGDGKLATQSR